MSVAPASAMRIDVMTRDDCSEWAEKPTVNPTTGRKIEVGKGTYKAIEKRCRDEFGIAPASASASAAVSAASRLPTELLPRRMHGWEVPRTAAQWRESAVRKGAMVLIDAVRTFGFITRNYITTYQELSDVLELLVEHSIIPKADSKTVTDGISEINNLISQNAVRTWSNTTMSYPRNIRQVAQATKNTMRNILTGAPTEYRVADLKNDLDVAMFDDYMKADGPLNPMVLADQREAIDLIVALEALIQDVILTRTSALDANDDVYALPESRDRSLPESLSRRRVKQKKPKRRPEDPDEYYPWSATEEDAPTDRSRFRSHAKLSVVSPGPQPTSPAAAPLPPLTPKKRTALLAELREACTVMKDMISMARFDRMNKKSLQLVVRLGPEDRQQRCYYVKNLYQLWVASAKDNKPFRDPLTRDAITADEKDEIMRKIRYVRPNAPDPRRHTIARDPKLKMNITRAENADGIGFYHIIVKRPVGHFMSFQMNLGYIPADIELASVNGDANMTSSAVISNLRSLFDNGRLLTSNVIPFQCCSIHLRKTMSHWLSGEALDLRRWKAFATEVYAAL